MSASQLLSTFWLSLTTTVGCGTCLASSFVVSVQAQPLAPSVSAAGDGTGSIVHRTEDTYTIEAGSFSDDGLNQLHSFDQFDLAPSESANFVALPTVSNIIGRSNSDQASLIHGTLTITGAEAAPHLYLLNPAGILFGESARLNLPGNLHLSFISILTKMYVLCNLFQ